MIIGVEGSPRKGGNSHKILDAVLFGAQQKGETSESIHLRDYDYKSCIGCEKCRKDKICTQFNDGMSLIYPKIIESKGIVLISPVHNYNVTAWMKAFIDRLYCFYEFDNKRPRGWSSRLSDQGRKAVIGAIAEQQEKRDMGFTLDAMRLPLEALGFEIVETVEILNVFDRGAVAKYADVLEKAHCAGAKLAAELSGSPS